MSLFGAVVRLSLWTSRPLSFHSSHTGVARLPALRAVEAPAGVAKFEAGLNPAPRSGFWRTWAI